MCQHYYVPTLLPSAGTTISQHYYVPTLLLCANTIMCQHYYVPILLCANTKLRWGRYVNKDLTFYKIARFKGDIDNQDQRIQNDASQVSV